MAKRSDRNHPWIVFVGPSLPVKDQAALLAGAQIWPPAARGDVWRALRERPSAIVLIDGVFEAQPSIWHHELLAALRSGVPLFGGASMGALRAAELWTHGMVGVGEIFTAFREGRLEDDSEVAVLHADSEHGHRCLTVPLVNVRHAAQLAREQHILTQPQALRLVDAAAGVFYQDRRWPEIVREAGFTPGILNRLMPWLAKTDTDLKAKDARETIATARAFLKSGAPAPAAKSAEGSSLVRRRRRQSVEQHPVRPERSATESKGRHFKFATLPLSGGGPFDSRLAASAQGERDSLLDSEELANEGLRKLLLAGWARTLGLRAPRDWIEQILRELSDRALPADELLRIAEDVALEAMLREHSQRVLQDGPSLEEGLHFEARLRGIHITPGEAAALTNPRRPARRAGPKRANAKRK